MWDIKDLCPRFLLVFFLLLFLKDSQSKFSENTTDFIRAYSLAEPSSDKAKNVSRLSERAKKKSWYNVLYPNYKTRSQEFKRLFKEVPAEERLIVGKSCLIIIQLNLKIDYTLRLKANKIIYIGRKANITNITLLFFRCNNLSNRNVHIVLGPD